MLIVDSLLPEGGAIESCAGKKANPLDEPRIEALSKFITDAQKLMDVEGVALGLVENGKVVFAGGFGVRERAKPAKVDADTRFMIASNSKALTTLMLAKLVDQKKLTWETTATSLLPDFKLGDADTTSKVLVKHLLLASSRPRVTAAPRPRWASPFTPPPVPAVTTDALARRLSSTSCAIRVHIRNGGLFMESASSKGRGRRQRRAPPPSRAGSGRPAGGRTWDTGCRTAGPPDALAQRPG